VDIGWKDAWVVQRSDANEPDLRSAPVVTPNRNFAFAAAIDVVWTIGPGNWDGFQRPAYYLYGRSLNDRIEDKCAASMPLTIGTVAAVHAHRRRQQFVANLSAGTTTTKFFSGSIPALVHVFRLGY
jgi:hypothetical protein